MRPVALLGLWIVALSLSACTQGQPADPNTIVVAIQAAPNNLDPRLGLDDASQKIHDLIFDKLMELDDHMRVVPHLAERLEHPTPTTYIVTLRKDVRFHDGHELTSADVVYTFRSFLDPDFVSPRKGGYRELRSVDALDRYTAIFTLNKVFTSFPINLVMPIIADGAPASLAAHPVGTGPYRFVRYATEDRLELTAFDGYFLGRPKNNRLVLKVVPDDIMRGLELRKGASDIVINDLTPDIAFQLEGNSRLQTLRTPGVDYQYIGLNLQDPILRDVRVRQALAYAIDRHAIVEYLRRGLATPARGLMPPLSWAFAGDAFSFPYEPAKARALLDEAGYAVRGGRSRFTLSYKISNSLDFNALQAAVIQQNLRDVGIELDLRTYEFATLFADVLKGNFQLYSLQWTAGSLADPDILRRVFHSQQVPPFGFNRGHYSNPRVDALLDEAAAETDESRRLDLFRDVQRIVALDVPYISLWNKTNLIVAQRSLSGISMNSLATLTFLKDVARVKDVAATGL